jgi:hypothetical protein
MKQLRIAGLFLANLFAAVMGTAIMESAIPFLSNLGLLLAREFVVAFVLGYFREPSRFGSTRVHSER